MKHHFSYLIKEYGKPFLLIPKVTQEYGDNGRPLPVKPQDPEERTGIILPLTKRDMEFAADGTYTRNDRRLIVRDPIELKSTIQYKGQDFTVMEAIDWEEYSDFNVYICKGASKK